MHFTTPHWLDREAYPFQPNFIIIDNHRLHYVDEGQGETLLFVHGTPSWSFDYRHVIKALSSQYRCIALDHIGFGLSDKPKDYNYSTQNHAQTLAIFIQTLQLRAITLILHDFGGPIGFDYAIRVPKNIQRIVVLNSWLWSSADDPTFQKLQKALKSPLLPVLYKYFNFSVRFLLPRSFGSKKLNTHIHRQYICPFSKIAHRDGPLAFAKSLLKDQPWFEALWQQREILQTKPMLLIWGIKDPFISTAYLQKFKEGFPQAKVMELANCGHFPQEEEGKQVAAMIGSFIRSTARKST
ncbi:MAG: alpha/beta fold hydrolase [Spirosomataceae bacterium]